MRDRGHDLTLRMGMVLVLVATSLAISAPAAALACVSTPAGLLARWPGNGSTNEVAHDRDGTLIGDATYAAGQVGQAYSFDGTGDGVAVADEPDWMLPGDFTIDTWINVPSIQGHPWVFVAHDQGSGFQPKWLFWRDQSGELGFYYGDQGSQETAVAVPWTPTESQWYHVAVTRSGETFSLYVDGALVATDTDARPIADADGPLTIGSAENDFWFPGLLDEPEIFQRALSGAEIDAIHDQGAANRCGITRSTVTLDADPTAFPGETVSLQGTLSLSGGAAVGNLPIEVSRSVDGAAWAPLTTVMTDAGGGFSYDDQPPNGSVRYRAAFQGATDVSAGNGWTTVEVAKEKPTVTISVSRPKITFGGSVTVSAHLKGGSTNRVVEIHAVPVGGGDRVLREDEVNSEGNLNVRADPKLTTSFYATYAGDARWKPDTSPSKTVQVAVKWTVKTTGGYATKNGVRLYHYSARCERGDSTGCPKATFTLAPSHAGDRVSFQGRYCGDGRCVDDSATFRLDSQSKAYIYIYYGDESAIGWTFFFRLSIAGHADHLGATSAWAKTKVTA